MLLSDNQGRHDRIYRYTYHHKNEFLTNLLMVLAWFLSLIAIGRDADISLQQAD